ncbi:MAG TPA: ATP-dependent helicase [Patescibacteria group bacterium]|nr:ATP-dependent helicase [Patescibacteria group bacterium]
MNALEGLNAQQQQAAMAGDGPVVIVAGPGTGKTKTLTARIAYLVCQEAVKPEQILALTFTKKAAEEMQMRVGSLLGIGQESKPVISTFHSLCHEILANEAQFVTEPQRLQLIKALPRPAALKGLSARELGLLISRTKNMAEDNANLRRITKAYDVALHQQDLIDYDDLLAQTYALLTKDAKRRAEIQARFAYILVDEFQDTNRLQYEILLLIKGNDNVFVIGDPNQSIYGFRGASGDIFAQFIKDFPKAKQITLTTNYRSAPEVVRLSNALFTDAPQLDAHSTLAGQVRAVQVLNEYSEAAWVLTEIQNAIGGGDLLHAVSDSSHGTERSLKDFAVLYRSRAAATTIQKLIQESGLPYQVVGDGSPYDRPQVQATIALMRACLAGDQPPHEGFTKAEWKAVLNLIQQNEQVSPHALAVHITTVLDFKLDIALQQFLGTLVRFGNLNDAVAYFNDIARQNFYDPAADAITLLTIHASKGLEFPYVFLVGAEDGILPHTNADAHEEKRLLYVAATRAKHHLDILYTQRRGGQPAQLSSFITDVPPDILPKITDPHLESDKRRAVKRAVKRSQQSLF